MDGDVRYGRQEPTQSYTLPYTETAGPEAVAFYNTNGKTKLLPWQESILYDIMATEDDGIWTHQKFGYSVTRRNGKTEDMLARVLWGLKHGEKILYTAHATETTHKLYEERFLPTVSDVGLVIASKFQAYGREHIYIADGGKIDFRTRTNSSGLGTGYDLLILDEAQELTPAQFAALKYTVTDSKNPQIIYLGTPPTPNSAGTEFRRYRDEVLAGDGIYSGWAEWGLTHEVDDVTNVDLWYETNPSLGYTLTERKIRGEIGRPQSKDAILDTEIQRLGLWLSYNQQSVISRKEWDALKVENPQFKGKLYIGVKFGFTTPSATMAIAVKTADEKVYLEVIDNRPTRAGVDWIMDFLKKADYKKVVVDGQSGVGILETAMQRAHLKPPVKLSTAEYIQANQQFEQALDAASICHGEQASVEQMIEHCKKRAIGGSGWGYETMNPNCDIGLIDAQVLAYYMAVNDEEEHRQVIRY